MKGRKMHENILNIHSAHQIATGKNIVVALLDHLFDKDHHVFIDRIVSPGCVIEECPVFSTEGHGTWIAEALMKEIKPQLSPLKTKKILLKSFTPTSQGYPLLDALKTLDNVVGAD